LRAKIWALSCICLILGACGPNRAVEISGNGDEVPGVANSAVSLNGTWKFTLTPPENFWSNDVRTDDWAEIEVPGECLMQGFNIEPNTGYPFRRQVSIPRDFAGNRIYLRFDGVYSYARVWVDGRYVRDHHGGFTSWECDITNLVEPGRTAWLTVEVTDRNDEISYGSGYAHHLVGGILRDVWLVARPQQHFSHLHVRTDFDSAYRNAGLTVRAGIAFRDGAEGRIDLALFDPKGKAVRFRPSRLDLTRENAEREIRIPVKSPAQWDAEHPNLYTLTASLRVGGKIIQRRSARIGFREITLAGNKLLVNGRPVKLRGACRHDVHPLLGRRTTADLDRLDVRLAKEANLNFIRTSHYPPSQAFLDHCDQYGVYVEEETAVCFVGTHRSPNYQPVSFSQDDPAFTERYLGQLAEMVERDQNHPSVIIWSIGNENKYGLNFQKEYDWVKTADPTRAVMFSYPGQAPRDANCYDILSLHYPSFEGNLSQYGIEAKDFSCGVIPVIFDEWAHVSCYNTATLKEDPNVRNAWGESLKKFWDKTYDSEAVGGAIWGMIDEVFMLPGSCVGYGPWGIVDGWRRKKPEFWHTKKAYSPVRVLQTEFQAVSPGQPLRIPVRNRFDHTNFCEIDLAWTYRGKTEIIPSPDVPPGGRGEILIPGRDWSGGELALLRFFQGRRLVDEEAVTIGGPPTESANRNVAEGAGRNWKIEETDKEIRAKADKLSFVISRRTGLIEKAMVEESVVLAGGPYFHLSILGRRPDSNQQSFEELPVRSWILDKMEWKKTDQEITIQVSGRMAGRRVDFNYLIRTDGANVTNFIAGEIPTGTGEPAEIGVAFELPEAAWLEWRRRGLWTTYPDGHTGRLEGTALLGTSAVDEYRREPRGGWSSAVWDFFLLGLDRPADTSFLLSNDARSLKENILTYNVGFEDSPGLLRVEARGEQAARLKASGDGRLRLLILTAWTYPDLDWGNYERSFNLQQNLRGRVTLMLTSNAPAGLRNQ
jgi:beta-galactosidase